MKLRNKKTGDIVDLAKRGLLKSDNDNHIILYTDGKLKYYTYKSLTELYEEWEDYEPKEPLVEGRKQRAVLKAAARLSGATTATVRRLDAERIVIFDFAGKCRVELKDIGINIKNNGLYTITDIYGEDKKKWRK